MRLGRNSGFVGQQGTRAPLGRHTLPYVGGRLKNVKHAFRRPVASSLQNSNGAAHPAFEAV
ncbi:hypothetical protein HMPREF9123_0583 [Neisseria bacilliformis ATCC BAA-1200]|uniref:Uncharacterized protein n=1 Tax=Neisseria bacilliformis ATCC BAA-1200 TaxID=888742 RepID=F2B9Y4_9NEIS|nr:hypothetical protein HMPREF9123_0583 [Neisseria bacilliformis ATCC BAA-1200]